MKKLFYLIVAIAVLGLIVPGCIPVVPPSEQDELGNLEIVSVSKNVGITIDGVLSSGEWDSYFWFTDNSAGPGTGYDDDPLPVFTGYLHFDETNLYLAFDVEDNTPNTNRDFLYITVDIPPAMIFNDPIDALYWGSVPANASFFGEAYLTGGSFPWDRSQRGSTWGTDGGVVTARTITDTNRYYELKIPLDAISASLGDTIGLKIQARGGQYTSETDPQVVNYFPDMPGGITPIRADTRVEVEGNFYLTPPPPIEVPVDIKPQSCPNPLNTKSKGVTPVAILGTADFDVTDIDPLTIILAGVFPLSWNLEDVATPYDGDPIDPEEPDCSLCTTEGSDGYLDLTLKFDTQKLLDAIGTVDSFEVSEEELNALESGESDQVTTTDGEILFDGACLVIQLEGLLWDGTPIIGEDVVRILEKGKK